MTLGNNTNKDAVTGARISAVKPATGSKAIEETIRVRAYEIFETRTNNGQDGDAVSDWLEAERELRQTDQFARL